MTYRKIFIFILSFQVVLFSGCGDDSSLSGPIKIINLYPSSNAFGVPVDTAIWVEFGDAINPATINETNFFLNNERSPVAATTAYVNSSFTASLKPNVPLQFSTFYTITLSGNIEGESGQQVEALSWSFITQSQSESGSDSLSARYRATFTARWGAETHPTDFPENAHFSGLIGITHKDSLEIIKVGELASPGLKIMAETGGKDQLISEFEELITSGDAQIVIDADGVSNSPGSVSFEFVIKSSHPSVTIFSMLVPSPDWFIAIQNVRLKSGNLWLPAQTSFFKVYDAGTDSGATFSSENQPTDPPEGIQPITTPPLATNGSVRNLGRITFEKIN